MTRFRISAWQWIRSLFTRSGSKAYCQCGHETLQDPSSLIYEGSTFTNIICSKCNRHTTWNLDAPVPLFIKSLK